MKLEFKGTPAPWSVPHFSDDKSKCNCTSILCEYYCGSVANINYSEDGADWREGDNPPIHEAKMNGHLIATAPDLLQAAMRLIENADNTGKVSATDFDKLKLAVHKALNIKE